MSVMETIKVPAETGTLEEPQRDHSALALFALVVIALVQASFAFTRSINWDEFYFYGQIVDFTQGEAIRPLQTLHVQLFQWLPGSFETGVDAILAGRFVLWVCAVATAGCIAAIAGKFVRRDYALTAALVWLTAGFTMQHGWSFRTDPIAALLVTASLAVLARARLRPIWIALCGVLVGAAGMVTLKSILFLPAFAGLAWLRWSQARFAIPAALRIGAIPMVAAAAFAAIYLWHEAALSGAATTTASAYVGGVSKSMLFAGWPIYFNFALKAAFLSIIAVAAIGVTIAVIAKRPRHEAIAIAGLLAPLAAILIYRNTLPYFYPMLLAPVVAGSAIGIVAIADRYGLGKVIGVAAISGLAIWAIDGPSHLDKQRELQIAADEIFEEPVGYFDFPDMLPGHRKANGFLTRWGIESAYASGPGYFRERLENETVPLLLTAEPEQNPTLLAVMRRLPQEVRFHEEERAVLRATYREFWGPFWLAGTEISAGTSTRYEVLVPGPYTITGGELTVGGTVYPLGAVITLERGFVELANGGANDAGIIWGNQLEAPQRLAIERPYWRGF